MSQKNLKAVFLQRMIPILLVLAVGTADAVEKAAKVVGVGTCWSGYWAVIAKMSNGDSLFLGNLSDETTKVRLATAMAAKASDEAIYYQITGTGVVCTINRSSVEWWILGVSIYQ